MCKASKSVHEVEEDEEEPILLSSITADADPWMVNLSIIDSSVAFKIVSGANLVVLPHTVFKDIYKDIDPPTLSKAKKPRLGPGGSPLDIMGITSLN